MRDLDPRKFARGIIRAQEYENSMTVIFWEFFVISVLVGVYFRSFVVFLLTIIGLRVCLWIPIFGRIVAFLISIVWGAIGGGVLWWFTHNIGIGAVVGVVVFLVSTGMHLSVRN